MSTKCLVFGRNPISKTTANSRTIAAYLRGFQSKDLAQIFTTPYKPDYDLCGNYFYVSERGMLSRFLGRKYIVDGIVPANLPDLPDNTSGVLESSLKKDALRPYSLILRDFIWRKRYWDTPAFWKWIEDFGPDVIFFGATDMPFEYEFVLEISRKYSIPITMRIADDYFTEVKKVPLLNAWEQNRVHNRFRTVYESSKLNVYICEYMKEAIEEKFGKTDSYSVISSCDIDTHYQPTEMAYDSSVLDIVYAGNMGLNRSDTIYMLTKALTVLKTRGIDAKISIYTNSDLPKDVRHHLEEEGNCEVFGALHLTDMYKRMNEANVLLHVESFSKRWETRLRTSLSTKSADLLYSKRIAMIIGPEYAGVVRLFAENHLGVVLSTTDYQEMADKLDKTLCNPEEINCLILRAHQYALEHYFDADVANIVFESMGKVKNCDYDVTE